MMIGGTLELPLLVSFRVIENLGLLITSFLLLLLGAEIFTNGVEWLGHRLGVSESATGSILAAVGTALPETMIPVIAIIHGFLTGDTAAADHVGVGAILGAPFMLATIAMFLVGASVLYFSERRLHGQEFHFNAAATRRDLRFFLIGFSLALLAAVLPSNLSLGPVPVTVGIAGVLVGLYGLYVYRSLQHGELIADDGLDSLYVGRIVERSEDLLSDTASSSNHGSDPHRGLVFVQTLLALVIIVAGAQLFVTEVQYFSVTVLHFPPAILALLLAPLATELPEKFNSIIWISRDKDTLAIGNITGAMAFQSTLPVMLGVLFTSWNLTFTWGTTGFLNAFSAILALLSGAILYHRAGSVGDANMQPLPFFVGGILYLIFIIVVLYHVFYLGISVS
ncbi:MULTISPECIES: sodium:calcium antiporter [Natrinema]|uniref:Ca2+/Na+ antiporter n=2 Tax=Natrinema TaxID=88723 RepID=L0JRF7_NATP1|nr:sodium/hydrogen exchanger [Natrinema pellirubrum]AGB34110.1 Ca2+/Na+ antiporter [Natrinema pellirubrum DSM 15624]ELY72186.1 Ca2+/Na+ antiporter [Natrinema pellirubrum DSM 15624]ELY81881.1 Ca2+/Na+ antiporter [Natrinema pallidum DSM 3751]